MAETWDVMAVGKQTVEPDRKETFRKALEWGLVIPIVPYPLEGRPSLVRVWFGGILGWF